MFLAYSFPSVYIYTRLYQPRVFPKYEFKMSLSLFVSLTWILLFILSLVLFKYVLCILYSPCLSSFPLLREGSISCDLGFHFQLWRGTYIDEHVIPTFIKTQRTQTNAHGHRIYKRMEHSLIWVRIQFTRKEFAHTNKKLLEIDAITYRKVENKRNTKRWKNKYQKVQKKQQPTKVQVEFIVMNLSEHPLLSYETT